MLHQLKSIKNIKSAKRLGRGLGSGKGKTAGRGSKGQKSRSGYNLPRSFEGGQTPLIQRLPKARGFKSRNAKPAIVHIIDIEKHFSDGDIVNFKTLISKGLIKDVSNGVKVIGPGKLNKSLRFADVKLTKKLLEDLKNLAVKSAKQAKLSVALAKGEKPSTKESPVKSSKAKPSTKAKPKTPSQETPAKFQPYSTRPRVG